MARTSGLNQVSHLYLHEKIHVWNMHVAQREASKLHSKGEDSLDVEEEQEGPLLRSNGELDTGC